MHHSLVFRRILLCAASLAVCCQIHALTVLNGPTLLASTNAPLACKIQLTTDVDSRVTVAVSSGTNSWWKGFYHYETNHSLILAGFEPDTTNTITVTVHDRSGSVLTVAGPLTFQTATLPSDFPPISLRTNQPDKMEPGYTLFRAHNAGNTFYMIIVNQSGKVVWYSNTSSQLDVRQRPDGNLFAYTSTNFFEMNLFGEVVSNWPAASGWSVDAHEGYPTDRGTILYLSAATRTITNFPGSSTDSNAPTHTVTVTHQPAVEIAMSNSASYQVWTTLDMIDPLHITYFYNGTTNNVDFEHSNGMVDDPADNSIIVSMRHQNAVIKFSRATGQLKWILGPHPNYASPYQQYLLTPVGTPFDWNYGQHAPSLSPQGTLMLYNNGNYRASPFDTSVDNSNNYSGAIEYSINEDTMEVSEVWEYGSNTAERFFTPTVGKVDRLPKTGNVLVSFANIRYVNGVAPNPYNTNSAMIRYQEVTHAEPAEVLFDLEVFDPTNTSPSYAGCSGYRSYRIPDLYSVIPSPIEDLSVNCIAGQVNLRFSADPAMNPQVEASSDLLQWASIGSPTDQTGLGDYTYQEALAGGNVARFYRIVSSPP